MYLDHAEAIRNILGNPKAMAEFKELYEEEFNEELSDDEAGVAVRCLPAVIKSILKVEKTTVH